MPESHESSDVASTNQLNPKSKIKYLILALLAISVIITGAGFIFFVCKFFFPLPLYLSKFEKVSLFVLEYMQNVTYILLLTGIILSTVTYMLARLFKIMKARKLASRIWIFCIICLAGMTYLCVDFLSRQRIAAWLCKPGHQFTFTCQDWDDSVSTLSKDVLRELQWTVTKRLDSEPIGYVLVTAVPPDKITVALDKRVFPPEQTYENLIRYLEQPGFLGFRILPKTTDSVLSQDDIKNYIESLSNKGPLITSSSEYVWCEIEENNITDFKDWTNQGAIVGQFDQKYFVLASNKSDECLLCNTEKNTWRLNRAYLTVDNMGRRAIGFVLNEAGGIMFSNLTGNNIDKSLCILIDNKAISAPNIESRISREGIITGSFTFTEAYDIMRILKFHPLPAKLQLVEQDINNTVKLKDAEMSIRR